MPSSGESSGRLERVVEHVSENSTLYIAITVLASTLGLEAVTSHGIEQTRTSSMLLLAGIMVLMRLSKEYNKKIPDNISKLIDQDPNYKDGMQKFFNVLDNLPVFTEPNNRLIEPEDEIDPYFENKNRIIELVNSLKNLQSVTLMNTLEGKQYKIIKGQQERYYLLLVSYCLDDSGDEHTQQLTMLPCDNHSVDYWDESDIKEFLLDESNGFVDNFVATENTNLSQNEQEFLDNLNYDSE